jgi:tetratricopeptide (TPR) repeat protein
VRRDAGRVAGEPVERRVPITWVAPFAGVAFVLLGLELAGATWRRRRRSALAATLAIALGAGAATDPDARPLLEARVRRNPGDARALLALGVARAESGEQDEAARALFAAAARARDPMLAARAYYDLGVVEIERGELEAARDAFYDALALHPEDREAKFNLEWTLRALGATPPPAPEDGAAAKPPPQVEPSEPDAVTPGEDGPQPNEVDSVRRGPEPARAEDPFAPAPLPSLSQAEAERWLEVVVDDPRRSLRDAVRSAGAGAPIVSRGTPQW